MSNLTGASISRFKGVATLDMDLHPVNVLIGGNNAGKSSVLQGLHFGVTLAQSMELAGGEWKGHELSVSLSESELLYLPVAEVEALAYNRQFTQDARVEIVYKFEDGQSTKVSFSRGKNRNLSSRVNGWNHGHLLTDWQNPVSVYVPGLAGIQKEEEHMSPAVVRKFAARGDANLVLRNILFLLSQSDPSWEAFMQEMNQVFPGLGIAVNFNADKDTHIDVRAWFGDGPSLPIDAAGTSVLQLCQLVSYAYLFKPKLLILDEPDAHIHPNNQRKLAQLCLRLAQELGMRVVISTHSRHLLDAFRGQAQTLWLRHGKVQQATQSEKEILLDLGALDSMDYFASGEKKCVVLTEDSDKQPLRVLLGSNGFNMDQTEVISYAGCTKADSAVVLGKFLREHTNGLRVLVHRDRDFLSDSTIEGLRTGMADNGIELYITASSDLEGEFCHLAHLAEINPGSDSKVLEGLINDAVAELRTYSLEKAINGRLQDEYQKRNLGQGGKPDAGAIALAVQAEYDAAPRRMTHGKRLLSLVRQKHVDTLKAQLVTTVPSTHLVAPGLSAIAGKLWPVQAPVQVDAPPAPQ